MRITNEAVQKAMLLIIAYFMEEYEFNDEEVCKCWDKCNEWCAEIDLKGSPHFLTLAKVVHIIEDYTGLKFNLKRSGNDYFD